MVQNLAKAIQIVTKAVEEDEKQNYKDAYHLYCEGLQYFVSLITSESDPNKRQQLQERAMTYMERAEEIKRSAKQAYLLQRQISQQNPVQTNEPCSSNKVKVALKPTSTFKELRKNKC